MTRAGTAAEAEAPAGVRAALRFIARVREDPALRAALKERATDGRLEPVVELAREQGFAIGVAQLRTAYAIDWGMRRALQLRS